MKKRIFISCLLLAAVMIINAQDQPAKSSAAERLAAAIDEHGLDTALKMFAKMRENPGGCDFSEQEFNALGNKLLEGQKFEAASAVFKLNVEMFPESWNTYYGLARACMYSGDKECAEQNFKIVLNKYPDNYFAERILADIDGRLERVAREREYSYKPGEQTGLKGPYLGQKPPGLTAEIFAPGIVSRALGHAFSCTFSPDGKEFYFNHFMTIMVCRLLDDGWTAPEPVAFTGNYRAHEPHITLDGKKLYFGWFRPTPEGFQKDPWDHGIYVCEKTADGWGEPKYVGLGMFVTSSRDGKVYVTEKKFTEKKENYAHIKQVTLENGVFVKLEPPGGGLADLHLHFPRTAHPGISPDGRTILFDVTAGYGLFAAYLDESGVWSKPVRLSEHGLSASAGIANYSPDGKYIFFRDGGDIYWISSEFVERLRPDKQRAINELKEELNKRKIEK
jgi:tetratricopeptide (TPR) repeat protein